MTIPSSTSHSDHGISIIGVGSHLPATWVSNEELCRELDVAPEWIVEKTGIRGRHVAASGDSASGYAAEASNGALEMAGISPEEIDLIVACTFSGDYLFPPVSAKLHGLLGAENAQVFDLQANCAGFVTGLTCASDRMKVDQSVRYSLVVGVELSTRFANRADASTAIFLSDGAGAAVLGRGPAGYGILSSAFHTDSSNYEAVRMRGGGSSFPFHNRLSDPSIDFMEMNGLATWKQAITHLPPTVRRSCEKAGLALADVDFFVFHQANLRLIEYIVRKMRSSMERTYTNVAEVGNSGSASLAIALCEAVEKGLIAEDDIVVLGGVGAGFNFAASTWRWKTVAKNE